MCAWEDTETAQIENSFEEDMCSYYWSENVKKEACNCSSTCSTSFAGYLTGVATFAAEDVVKATTLGNASVLGYSLSAIHRSPSRNSETTAESLKKSKGSPFSMGFPLKATGSEWMNRLEGYLMTFLQIPPFSRYRYVRLQSNIQKELVSNL
jgi:hypothetical protein